MYITISNKIIREFKPCYDPSKYITDENEELPIKNWIQKYRSMISSEDILWLLLRKEFLSEKDLRLFGVWCAREALKLIKNPDERSVESCNVAERYANGEATKEELDAAYVAAHDAAHDYDAAYDAVYDVPYDYDANVAAFFIAANSAVTAARAASSYAAHAAHAAAFAAQLDKLLTYF